MMTAAGGETTHQVLPMTEEQRAKRIRELRQELIRLTREGSLKKN
jgi:hypothetical protein